MRISRSPLKSSTRSELEIARALDHLKVPEREKHELLAVIVSKKTEVVSS